MSSRDSANGQLYEVDTAVLIHKLVQCRVEIIFDWRSE